MKGRFQQNIGDINIGPLTGPGGAAARGLTAAEQAWIDWNGAGGTATVVTANIDTNSGGIQDGIALGRSDTSEYIIAYNDITATDLVARALVPNFGAGTVAIGAEISLLTSTQPITAMFPLTTARDTLLTSENSARILRVSSTSTLTEVTTASVEPGSSSVCRDYTQYDIDKFLGVSIDAAGGSGNLDARSFDVLTPGTINVDSTNDTTYNNDGAAGAPDIMVQAVADDAAVCFIKNTSTSGSSHIDAILLTRSGTTWTLDSSISQIANEATIPASANALQITGVDQNPIVGQRTIRSLQSNGKTIAAGFVLSDGAVGGGYWVAVEYDPVSVDITAVFPDSTNAEKLSAGHLVNTPSQTVDCVSTFGGAGFDEFFVVGKNGSNIDHAGIHKIDVNANHVHPKNAVDITPETSTAPTHSIFAIGMEIDLLNGLFVSTQLNSATIGEIYAKTIKPV